MKKSKEAKKNCKISAIKTFGDNIRFLRIRQNMTIKDWAKFLNYDRNRLAELEQGFQDIKLNTALKIAKTVDKDFSMLFSNSFKDDFNICQNKKFIDKNYMEIFKKNSYKAINEINLKKCDIDDAKRETISRILNGHVENPHIKTLSNIADKLQVSLSKLFFTEE